MTLTQANVFVDDSEIKLDSSLDYDFKLPEDFLPINCKFCNGFISAKLGSRLLVCLECNTEFELKEKEIE